MSDTAVATRNVAVRPLPEKRAAIAALIAARQVAYNPHRGPAWYLDDTDEPVAGSPGRALRAMRTQGLLQVDLAATPDARGAYPVSLTPAGVAALARHQGHAA